MRLDKYLKHALCISRTDVVKLINSKQVLVNNSKVSKDYDVKNGDLVTYNGKLIEYKEYYYFMLNKPSGYVSSTSSSDGLPVTNIIKERDDLFPVGRLDKDTEGLLILTNDGSLTHKLTSPKYEVEKKYLVCAKYDIRKEDIVSFENGVAIKVDGKNYKCLPARLELIENDKCYVCIKEGKFHQVKEMFKAINNEVTYLKRVKIGSLELDDNLKIGEYRELTNEELAKIMPVK